MKEKHQQCRLTRGNEVTTSYLPVEFAEEGRVVDLRDENKAWDRGWTVDKVFPGQLDSKYVAERSQDYKLTRRASDV